MTGAMEACKMSIQVLNTVGSMVVSQKVVALKHMHPTRDMQKCLMVSACKSLHYAHYSTCPSAVQSRKPAKNKRKLDRCLTAGQKSKIPVSC